MRKPNSVKRSQIKVSLEHRYKMFSSDAHKPANDRETVEEFLKRGGSIKTYAYKKPPVWKNTFNGFSKYDRRK